MPFIFVLLFMILFSLALSHFGRKIKIPSVVSLIVAGLIFGAGFFKNNFIGNNASLVLFLGDIGLFVLMFLAGMETSWKMLRDEEKNSAYIASFGFFVPFILGFGVFTLLGFSALVSIIIGLSMSITAEATKARVLLDLHKLRTKVGSAMIGAGIIDDVLGLVAFVIVSLIHHIGVSDTFFTLGIIFSFFFGILVQSMLKGKYLEYTKKFLFLFVPFFFISMGLHFDFGALILSPLILILVVVIAFSGKMLGVLFTKPFTNFDFKKLFLVGWAMNSRGAIELGFALIAFNLGIIPVDLYSALVIMALVTTLIFPFVITRLIKRNPKIMD